MKPGRKEILADGALFMVACIWGSTFIVVKEAVESTPVYSFLFMRFGLAAFLLALVNLFRWQPLTRRVWIDGGILGTVLFMVFAFQTYGLTTTPASVTAFITGLYVVFVPVLLSVISLRRPPLPVAICVGLAVTGLALVTLRESISLATGEGLVLICAVWCAVHIILTDRYSKRNDAAVLTMVQVAVVAGYAGLFSLIYDPALLPSRIGGDLIVALVVTGVFATVVAFGVQTGVQRFTSPSHTAIIFTMEPVAAAIISALMGENLLSPRQYLGAVLIIASMVLVKVLPGSSGREVKR